MEHMNRKFPKGNDLLREHKESTLEKNEKARNKPNPQELAVGGKGDLLNPLNNKRMKRKAALLDAMNKIHDPDIA